MIIDKLSNLKKYEQFKKTQEEIYLFINRYEKRKMEPGKYIIRGGELFALVQKYQTKLKENTRMESHKRYADLQYIVKGTEIIYYDCSEELEVQEDKLIESDIVFYEKKSDKGGIVLTQGMFGYYEPQDAHMPCIQNGDEVIEIEKIVFKIKL